MPISKDKVRELHKGIENDLLLLRLWLKDSEEQSKERLETFRESFKSQVEELDALIEEGLKSEAPISAD